MSAEMDLDAAVEQADTLRRAARALEKLAALPDAVSQLARALERVGDQIELGLETLANRLGPPP